MQYQKKWCREKHPCQKWCDKPVSQNGFFLPLTKMVHLDLWIKPRTTKNEHEKAGHPCYSQGCLITMRRYAISIDDVLMWWFRLDLNQRHKALQASALPTELQNHTSIIPQLTPNSKAQATAAPKNKAPNRAYLMHLKHPMLY